MYRYSIGPKCVSLTCPTCNTIHTDCPVDRDEDGVYAAIETTPCSDDECPLHLCSCCDQAVCECCGLTFCIDHIKQYEEDCACVFDGDQADATYCYLHGPRRKPFTYLCRVCSAPEEPARIEPAVAVAAVAAIAEVA